VKKTLPFIYLLSIIFLFSYCKPPHVDLETIIKDNDFRQAIKTGSFAKLSNGFTYYELTHAAADTLVVLVHGFSVPSYIWDSTYHALSAKGYGVLRYDTYGRGYSDNPPVVYDVALFSNQLSELLNEVQINRPFTLVGLSDGGRTISAFAFQYPERITNLVYVDAVGFTPVADTTTYPAIVTEEEIADFKQSQRYATMASGQLTDFFDSIPFRGWDKRYLENMRFTGFVHAILSTDKNRTDLTFEHQKIAQSAIPVYAIWGEHDAVVKLHDIKESMLQRLPSIKLWVVPQTGHLPHMEDVNTFNTILMDSILRKK
jgi:pimeloyl-ACP methyl ester carboxylesterase